MCSCFFPLQCPRRRITKSTLCNLNWKSDHTRPRLSTTGRLSSSSDNNNNNNNNSPLPLNPRCRLMTCATCLVRSCTEVTSRTTGTAACAGPTWRNTSGPRWWRESCSSPQASLCPATWTTAATTRWRPKHWRRQFMQGQRVCIKSAWITRRGLQMVTESLERGKQQVWYENGSVMSKAMALQLPHCGLWNVNSGAVWLNWIHYNYICFCFFQPLYSKQCGVLTFKAKPSELIVDHYWTLFWT